MKKVLQQANCGAVKSVVNHGISQKILKLYPDTRSEQECTFLSFPANETSIIANQLDGALKSSVVNHRIS